tara:strand:+ start:1090 stop:1413 length:324 start_codon:yes stop_codon:yes gene_type:complete
MGLQSTGGSASGSAKPSGGIAKQNSGGGVFYTVPDGKYAVVWLSWTKNNYGISVNGTTMFTNEDASNQGTSGGSYHTFAGPITLYEGMTVGRGASGSARVVGAEYDL